jgi:hypothetical protein
MKILNITRVATAASIAGALVVAAIAYASANKIPAPQPVTANVTNPASLPKFAHVQVVNATPEQIAALSRQSSQYAAAQRAYVDAQTGQLRPAFPEELAEEAAAPAAQAVASEPVHMANGATKMMLDESHMSYAVAHVESDGSVKEECVTDQPNEKAALSVAASSGDRHDK